MFSTARPSRRPALVRGALALAAAPVMAGACSNTEVGDFRADLPPGLTSRYSAGESARGSGASFSLPLVASSHEIVSRSGDGFEGCDVDTLGPLGLLLRSKERSRWDGEGELREYTVTARLLTGLLWDETYSESPGDGRVLDSVRVAYGLLGYAGATGGAKTLYVLWIPIPLAGPRAPPEPAS